MATKKPTFTIVEVEEDARSAFPGAEFHNALFDNMVFPIADRMVVGYRGGYWHYGYVCKGKTRVPFMYPRDQEGGFSLKNIFSGEAVHNIPQHLAGVIITIFAVTYAIETCRRPAIQDKLIVLKDRLLDVAIKMCSELKRMDIYMTILD